MDINVIILSVLRAAGFEVQSLTARTLQERGLTALATFRLQIYALILGAIWCLFFVRPQDVSHILKTPSLLTYMLLIPIIWNISEFLFYYILNKTNSMSVLSTLRSVILLPSLLVFGAFFNHDTPNLLSIISIGILVTGLIMQPTQHGQNKRTTYSLPVIAMVSLALVQTVFETIHFGLMRASLQQLDPKVFLGIFSVLTLGLSLIWTSSYMRRISIKPLSLSQHVSLQQLAIPALWFSASIAEMYAQAKLPIYTLVAIGTMTFLMDVGADLFQRRIQFNLRTCSFIGLVILGITLSIFAI